MTRTLKAVCAAFIVAFIANLVGVLLFFKPIAESDTSIVHVHPALGLLVYVGLCIALFEWAARQMNSVYKAAFIVAAPQFVLGVDLAFRGERGLLTVAAGAILLAVTWAVVPYVYSLFVHESRREGRR